MSQILEQSPEKIEVKEKPLKKLEITEFVDGGLLREKEFRRKLSEFDWSPYRDETVLVKGCSDIPIPTWAYMVVTAHLMPVAKRILYGEPCSAVLIHKR